MRSTSFLTLLLLLLAPVLPVVASESPAATPAAHEELGRTFDDLAVQLQGLGTRLREHFAARDPHVARPVITLMLRNRNELGLSPAQVETLERLRADFQREAIRRDADLRIAVMDLAALLEKDPVDLGPVEAKLREVERLRVDLRLARIRAIEQGKAQLTAEQRAKLRTLLAEPEHGWPRPRRGAALTPRADRLFSF